MSASIQEAIALLNLQPGKPYRTKVNGQEVEVRIVEKAPTEEPPEEPSQFADQMMLDLWLDIPLSPDARTIIVQPGELMLPSPYHLDESDLAPE